MSGKLGKIERIDRKLVHKGHIINFYEDTMRLPDGREVVWDIVGHKGASAVMAKKKNGNYLMVRQYRDAVQRETLEIPAGGKDSAQEDPMLTAKRELEEETGYRSEKLKLLTSLQTTVGFCEEVIDIYLATDLEKGEQHLDEDEYMNIEEYSLDELVAKVFSGEIRDGKTIAAIMMCRVMETEEIELKE